MSAESGMEKIEKLTKDYSDSRQVLIDRVRELEGKITGIKKAALPLIRRAVEIVANKYTLLKEAIEESRELFAKPRTRLLWGTKVGMQKAKGKLVWESEDDVVRLIKKHFPEQADVLIKTKEIPSRDALANLSVADLKKLGVRVMDDTDEVVIKPTDSDVDKLVDVLLEDDEPLEAA